MQNQILDQGSEETVSTLMPAGLTVAMCTPFSHTRQPFVQFMKHGALNEEELAMFSAVLRTANLVTADTAVAAADKTAHVAAGRAAAAADKAALVAAQVGFKENTWSVDDPCLSDIIDEAWPYSGKNKLSFFYTLQLLVTVSPCILCIPMIIVSLELSCVLFLGLILCERHLSPVLTVHATPPTQAQWGDAYV